MDRMFHYLIVCFIPINHGFILRDKEDIILVPSVTFRDH